MKNTLDNCALIRCMKNLAFLLQRNSFSVCHTVAFNFLITQQGRLKPQTPLKLCIRMCFFCETHETQTFIFEIQKWALFFSTELKA